MMHSYIKKAVYVYIISFLEVLVHLKDRVGRSRRDSPWPH